MIPWIDWLYSWIRYPSSKKSETLEARGERGSLGRRNGDWEMAVKRTVDLSWKCLFVCSFELLNNGYDGVVTGCSQWAVWRERKLQDGGRF